MSSYYTPWTWSEPHKRHYSYLMGPGHQILDTLWSGPSNSSTASHGTTASLAPTAGRASTTYAKAGDVVDQGTQDEEEEEGDNDDGIDDDEEEEGQIGSVILDTGKGRVDSGVQCQQNPHSTRSYGPTFAFASSTTYPTQTYAAQTPYYQAAHSVSRNHAYGHNPKSHSQPSKQNTSQPAQTVASGVPQARASVNVLPLDVQHSIGYKDRRFIQTGPDLGSSEVLDSRYRRVAKTHHNQFFVLGRVFKMLWTEPAGQANPGKTRNSTHYSVAWLGETAYSEIRRFVVVRNKGTFSQCIPIQTYGGRGAAKPGLITTDHGIIHTGAIAPNQLPGEYLTKYSIHVAPTGSETLEPESRVNYGKPYVVEHNVKVLDIGIVVPGHRYLIESYFESALRGQ